MQSLFEDILGKENVFLNEPMKNHTTFHIGGGADYFLEITDETALLKVIKICREKNMPVFVQTYFISDFFIRYQFSTVKIPGSKYAGSKSTQMGTDSQ